MKRTTLTPVALTGLMLSGCVSTRVPHTAYLPTVQRKGEAEAQLATNLNAS